MDEIGVKKIGIDLVNVANEPIDFFIKESSDNAQLFDEGNNVATNINNENKYHAISWTSASPMVIDIGIQDTNSQSIQSQTTEITLNNKQKLWAIGWLNDTDLTVSTALEQVQPIEDKYSIQIFSTNDTEIELRRFSSTSQVTLEKGTFSNQIILDSCSDILTMGFGLTNQTNACVLGLDVGKAYLLIIDGKDLLLAAEADNNYK
ncbi:hypothetical protein C9I98_05625 [Photobacterium sanctipauli]|uniref:Uncharacterized protein n=3 Tax=Photobacterium sanctipauli TaxID=1342794 RepID=A0A2T3NYR1_9GAMM|nr:hypothetical protein C9I98_05625 [Photobacterium sanctipauli]